MVYVSLRDGFGYRDTVVDIQGVIHMDPELAGRQLRFMLSGQVSTGGGLPLVTVDLQPGHEHPPESAEYAKKTGYHDYRCDDHLWLFQTVPMYINETGQTEFLDEVIPYADTGEATVYEHLKKALEFSLGRLGTHGLVQGLKADWNDCLRMGRTGESVFASMQLYMGFQQFAEYADLKQRPEDSAWAKEQARILAENLNTHAWEQDRFVRGFSTVDGYTVGSKENEEGSLWLNPQAWSVISGFDRDTRAKKALDNVEQQLATDYGCMLMYPALRTYGFPVARMILFPAGVKENAGIFSQAQGWIIFAEALMGHGNRAYSYYQRVNPASLNEQAELRETEPYAHSQFTEGVDSPHHGRSHNSWLTGTASTMMVAAVHGILGIRPVADGLKIDPSIPSTWDTFSIKRAFRGKKLDIQVNNPDGVEHGVVKTVINGETIEGGGVIPFARMKETNTVEVTMGKV
jgi:cellobiose phosphorylase